MSIDSAIELYNAWSISANPSKSPSKWIESSEKIMDFGDLVPAHTFRFIWVNNQQYMQLMVYGNNPSDNRIKISSTYDIKDCFTIRGVALPLNP